MQRSLVCVGVRDFEIRAVAEPRTNDSHLVLRLDMGDIEAANRDELTMQLVSMVLVPARLWRARDKPTWIPRVV